MSIYRCNKCGGYYRRKFKNEKWRKTYCYVTGQDARFYKVNGRKLKKGVLIKD